jgi:quercetin dioxygenase-like cupin family protein
MKLKLLGLALVATLVTAAPSLGGGAPITAKVLGFGAMPATTIHTKAGAMVLNAITIQPGGSFGWHTHGAPVAVVVKTGTLTVFDPSVAGCKPFKVSQGKAFVEPAGHVHLARNDTKTPVTVYAMYLGLPKNAAANAPAAEPAGCDA